MADSLTNQPKIDGEEILAGVKRWIEIESPSHDAVAVNRMVSEVETTMQEVGTLTERIPGRDGFGDILKAKSPWGGEGPGILVLSHLDTVHPIGFIKDTLPFRRDGDVVYGPGIYDMKAGAYLAYYAYRHLIRMGQKTKLPVRFLFVPEEEVGSPTSRAMIEAEARNAKYVLVTEPARDGGKIVTSRKGVARFVVKTEGLVAQQPQHGRQRKILRVVVGVFVRAFQFDADREIITRCATRVAGDARMPGTPV